MVQQVEVTLPTIEFRNFTGINNVADPLRLRPDELREAVNVDIIDKRIVSRGGTVKRYTPSGATHSFWSNNRFAFFVEGNDLRLFNKDFTSTLLKAGVGNAKMEFAELFDMGNSVYFTSITANGCLVEDNVTSLMTAKTFSASTERFKLELPTAQHVDYFNARLVIGRNNLLIFSDAGKYGTYDKRDNIFPMQDEITMIKAVDDGLYIALGDVSGHGDTYFLAGNDISDYGQPGAFRKVVASGVRQGSAVKLGAKFIGGENRQGKAVIWVAKDGVYAGFNGGEVINLTKEKYNITSERFGAGYIRDKDGTPQYICTLWT